MFYAQLPNVAELKADLVGAGAALDVSGAHLLVTERFELGEDFVESHDRHFVNDRSVGIV